ncbi:hypothetical protein [Mesorhizobium japonicum]|uniref:hypothetical protein n=1 Tax=Mesorhizobium japonicum TaxID=2066070 RepID=UPI003B5B169A
MSDLTDALASGQPDLLKQALSHAVVEVLITAADAESFGAVERIAIATDRDQSRGIMVFTSPETRRRFDPTADSRTVHGSDVIVIAREQKVDVVHFDSAGPVAVTLPVVQLEAIVDGIGGAGATGVIDGLVVRSAGYDVLAVLSVLSSVLGPGRDVRMFERVVGDRSLPTLGVVATDDEMSRIAAELGGRLDLAVLDLIQLDGALAERIDVALPGARSVTV